MKNTIKTALILITTLATGFSMDCFAQTISADTFKSIVAQQAKKDLERYNIDDCEISVGHLPINSLELPDGKITVEIVTNSTGIMAREFKKININVNGKYARSYYAPIETKAYKYTAVAKEIIQRDKVIPLHSVEFKKINVTGNINNTVDRTDLTKELIATKVFYPGEMISRRYTTTKPDIIKNAMVTVNFKAGDNLNVAVDGVALMQGNIGDTIQVKNKRFNKIYTGEITGTNQVLVKI